MQKITDQERLKPWMGFVLFGFVMAVFVTVCARMQMNWGIPGLVLTELLLVGIAVLFCVIRKVRIKEVFPMKKISLRDFFGCILLLIGGYLFSILSVLIMAVIVPESYQEAVELGGFLYDGNMSFLTTLIVVAILPGICEESIYRGAILSTFRSFKHEWVAIVLVGLFFSINHLSVLRGPFTFIVGMILAYVVVKKNNILLSMMMHCMLNGFSVTLSYSNIDPEQVQAAAEMGVTLQSVGVYLILGCVAPILLVTGMMLINPEGHKAKRYITAGILTGVMFIVGIILTVTARPASIFTMNGSYEVTEEAFETGYFTIEEEKEVTLIVVMTSADGFYRASLVDRDGETACASDMGDGKIKTYTSTVLLPAGEYEVVITSSEDTIGQTPVYNIVVQ
ncbi:MAG: CPBP family intramembrane metalloprotease [Lachnospiraceae bacterium]|nr:CPBP family intramembrane metalloprotease [Lachnospiraceae bacterium]